jgi:MFS family permease
VSCGFPPVQSATAYGVLSLFSLIGMISYGWLSDRYHRPMLLASCYFVRALTFIMLMYITDNTPLLFAFAALFGIFDYATFPIVASLVATHIGRNVMGITMGLIFALHSLGGALGSFMGGWLFEMFARYDWVWMASVGLALLASFLSIMIRENREPQTLAPAQRAA